jgi:N-acetylneuraminic acid mutarotase
VVARTLPIRLPEPIAREAVVPTTGTSVMVAGGLRPGDSSTAAAYTLDLRSGAVHALPPLAVPVHDTAGARVGRRALVVGGGNASEQAVVEASAGGRWRIVGHLPRARSDLSVAYVAGRVLALGGYNGSRPAEPDILASREGRSWSVVGRLSVPVRYAATAVAGGSVWVLGGEVAGTMQTAVQRIDPRTGQARVVAHLPHRIGHATAVAVGDRILLVGGRTGVDTPTAAMWWFDPATGAVRAAGRLPTPLADSAGVQVGDTAYLIGGETPAESRHLIALAVR